MKRIDTGIDVGDTIVLGESLSHVDVDTNGYGVSLEALSEGEESEYVVLKETNVQHKDEIDLHPQSRILGFVNGSGVMEDSLIYCVPKSVYGGSE